jgi:hypothetical protein
MKRTFFVVLCLSASAICQAALPSAGEIILIGAQTDDEVFAFLTLEDSLDLRGLNYTDDEFDTNDNTGFVDMNEGEGVLPSDIGWSNVSKGTVVLVGNGISADNDASDGILAAPYTDTSVNLSGSGDSIVIFAAAANYTNATPSDLIGGMVVEDTSWSNHTSGGTEPVSSPSWAFIAHGTSDNMVYSGSTTSGTAQEVVTAIENDINWSGTDSAGTTSFITSFTLSTSLPVELDLFLVE